MSYNNMENMGSTLILKKINDTINNIENRFRRPISSNKYQNQQVNNPIYYQQNSPNLYTFPKNNNEESEFTNPINDYKLSKLIKEQFSNLIVPYQQDILNSINNLESKILKNSI